MATVNFVPYEIQNITYLKNTLDYVDRQLMDVDRSLSEMLNGIRLERNEVRNRR